MSEFFQKTVLIAGGTSGIGRAIAEAFFAAGAYVIAAGLPETEPLTAGIRCVAMDVTETPTIDEVVGTLDELHVLVNAAGIIRRDQEFELDIFSQVVDVNLTGAMRMCMACHPKLLRGRGSVVNVASMLSFFGGARVPAYSASKGGIAQLTRSLAVAWAPDGIRVNAVAPGWVTTPLTRALQEDAARSAALMSRTPMGRWGQPEEIAGPVLFLCSEAASFITGAILAIDGGYSAA